MSQKSTKQLAEEMPDSALAVGELESVQEVLREILSNPGDIREAIEEYVEVVGARIEQLDDSGKAREWEAAWREAEERERAENLRRPSR